MSSTEQFISRVDFVSIPVRDFDAAVRFYGETLALPQSMSRPDRGFAEFETGNVTLGLFMPEKMGREHVPSSGPVALHVDDVEKSRARLESQGVKFFAETMDTGVCHMAFFGDPDGNALLLHHRYAPRT